MGIAGARQGDDSSRPRLPGFRLRIDPLRALSDNRPQSGSPATNLRRGPPCTRSDAFRTMCSATSPARLRALAALLAVDHDRRRLRHRQGEAGTAKTIGTTKDDRHGRDNRHDRARPRQPARPRPPTTGQGRSIDRTCSSTSTSVTNGSAGHSPASWTRPTRRSGSRASRTASRSSGRRSASEAEVIETRGHEVEIPQQLPHPAARPRAQGEHLPRLHHRPGLQQRHQTPTASRTTRAPHCRPRSQEDSPTPSTSGRPSTSTSGSDIGPKVFARYDKNWDPWRFFLEQQAFWRTDDGWGGRTKVNFDYVLPDKASFIRWANKADYYEELYDVGLQVRAHLPAEILLGHRALGGGRGGLQPLRRRPEEERHVPRRPRPGQRPRTTAGCGSIGKGWRPWIEWEVMPGYYYQWEQDDPWRWGIDVRLSVMYESYLGGGISSGAPIRGGGSPASACARQHDCARLD